MRTAGVPNDFVTPRLTNGDEFFGWLVRIEVVSFGWVTYRNRAVGFVPLAESQARAFLFSFHTFKGYRGRGFYTALLFAIRHILGDEKIIDFIIDVNFHTAASMRGIKNAGFSPTAQISYITIFNSWRCCFNRTVLDKTGSSLFSSK
jgi:hypothetical protein